MWCQCQIVMHEARDSSTLIDFVRNKIINKIKKSDERADKWVTQITMSGPMAMQIASVSRQSLLTWSPLASFSRQNAPLIRRKPNSARHVSLKTTSVLQLLGVWWWRGPCKASVLYVSVFGHCFGKGKVSANPQPLFFFFFFFCSYLLFFYWKKKYIFL